VSFTVLSETATAPQSPSFAPAWAFEALAPAIAKVPMNPSSSAVTSIAPLTVRLPPASSGVSLVRAPISASVVRSTSLIETDPPIPARSASATAPADRDQVSRVVRPHLQVARDLDRGAVFDLRDRRVADLLV
jgi:hypothetical protein